MPKTRCPEPAVTVSSVWRCGNHVYMCSDLMAPDETGYRKQLTEGSFPGVPRPTLVYTDPPWGQGLANGFRTKAGLGRAAYDWTEIYRVIAVAARELGIPAWFEGPEITKPDGMKIPGVIMTGPGYRQYHRISYFGGNSCGLYYASPSVQPPAVQLYSRAGFSVPEQVLRCYPVGTLLDPCSGLGGMPLVAELLGWSSVNNELNPGRMARALARMADACGASPERIA